MTVNGWVWGDARVSREGVGAFNGSLFFEIPAKRKEGVPESGRDAPSRVTTSSVPPQLMRTMDRFLPSLGRRSPRFWSSW